MDSTLQTATPVNFYNEGAELIETLSSIMELIKKRGINIQLYHLVMLRASQINGCGYCVEMHTREARADGETNARLDQLVTWQHSKEYSESEKTAFAWTEALTSLRDPHAYARLRIELRSHFNEAEITTLTTLVSMINLWNRIQISNH